MMAELYEFSPPGWIARLRYTPLSDLLRGDCTARLDPRSVIAAAELPVPLPSLIYTVIRGTRLWRSEKSDVARELIAHFADGLAAGRSADDLARDFGSPNQAAKLIRQAKLRNRPLVWQSWHFGARFVMWALAVGCVAYIAVTVRFYLGRPAIAHNYWHEINDARRVPEADRAWPLYREALYKIGKGDLARIDPDLLNDGPGSEGWDAAVALRNRNRDALELTRKGAAKPDFGFNLGDKSDVDTAIAARAEWMVGKDMPLADQNKDLISAIVEGHQQSRTVARLLAVDARVAAVDGDGATVLADLTAMISLSEQLFQPRATLVEQLVGMANFSIATDTVGRILADTPAVLSDDQLKDLAHRIAAWRNGNKAIDFSGERMLFEDVLQRAYTDDGHGDGRMTPSGMALLVAYTDAAPAILRACDPTAKGDGLTVIASRAMAPGLAFLVGRREENRELYNSILDEMIAAHQGPSWQWSRRAIDGNEDRLKATMSGITNKFRYYFVGLLLPALPAVFNAAEHHIQLQDAAEAVVALELWHRRHGQWPARLDELVPELLPAVPVDRLDGQPLRYLVRDGQPTLYSLGKDRRDGGGHPPKNPVRVIGSVDGPIELQPTPSDNSASDWILWPPIRKTGD
jgi:hypothetical protein